MQVDLPKKAKIDDARVRELTQKVFGIDDASDERIERVQKAIKDWYDSFAHAFYQWDNLDGEGADHALFLQVGHTAEGPEFLIITENKKYARLILREQTIHENIRNVSPEELCRKILTNDDFHYDENGGNKLGAYAAQRLSFSWLQHEVLRPDYSTSSVRNDAICEAAEYVQEDDKDDDFGYADQYPAALDELDKYLESVEFQRRKAIMKQWLVQCMDAAALKAIVKARLWDVWAYEWLIGENTGVGERKLASGPDAQRNRQQAAMAFPALLTFLRGDNVWSNRPLREKIDNGEPLVLSLAWAMAQERRTYRNEAVSYQKEFVKWLGRQTRFSVDGRRQESNPFLIHGWESTWPAVSRLPREWRPTNTQEWRAISKSSYDMRGVPYLLNRSSDDILIELARAYSRPKGLPKNLLPVGKNVPDSLVRFFESEQMQSDMRNISDFARRLVEQLILPAIMQHARQHGIKWDEDFEKLMKVELPDNGFSRFDFPSCLVENIFEKLGVVKLLSTSKRWHAHAAGLERRTGTIDKAISWEALTEVVISPKDVNIRPLSSSEELKAVGEEMNNCAGGYAHACAIRNSHVILLEATDGSWKTLAELTEQKNDKEKIQLSVVQHELPGNKQAIPAEAENALNWYIRSIHKGTLKPDWDAIEASRLEHRKDELLIKIGFDPFSAEAHQAAYEAWRGSMPDLFPEPSVEAFLEARGIMDAIRENLPAPKARNKGLLRHLLPS